MTSDLIAITTSTRFDDLLAICLPHNYPFFKKWFIITSDKDTKTIDVVNTFKETHDNRNCIELLFFDFFAGKRKFNKGGAIRYAQTIVNDRFQDYPILLIDSDIVLPDNFLDIMRSIQPKQTEKCQRKGCAFKKHIQTSNNGGTHCCLRCKNNMGHGDKCQKNLFTIDNTKSELTKVPNLSPFTMYGTEYRTEHYSYSHFKNNIIDSIKKKRDCIGYFQLYRQHPHFLYVPSDSAAICDETFRDKFFPPKNRVYLDIIPKHMGIVGKHWNLRKDKKDFKIDMPLDK
jgi:hypothetical protein